MPINGPSGQSFPTEFLPDAGSANLVGVSLGDALPYQTRMLVVRQQSNNTFLQSERLTGLAALRYQSQEDISVAGGVPLDFNTADFLGVVLEGNTTFQWPVVPSVRSRMTMLIVQDATGGWTVTWPAGILWEGGTPPVVTPAAGAVTKIEFTAMFNPLTFAPGLYGEARLNYL